MFKHEFIVNGVVSKVLVEYVKKERYKFSKKRNRFSKEKMKDNVGVLVAAVRTDKPNNFFVTWSKVNEKAGDKFDKQEGVELALDRLYDDTEGYEFPDSISKDYEKFVERVSRYFKDKTFIELR